MAESKPFKLDAIDRRSALWLKLRTHFELRLETLRARNDSNIDENKTAHLRGSIADVKYLLSLDQDAPAQPPEDDLFKD